MPIEVRVIIFLFCSARKRLSTRHRSHSHRTGICPDPTSLLAHVQVSSNAKATAHHSPSLRKCEAVDLTNATQTPSYDGWSHGYDSDIVRQFCQPLYFVMARACLQQWRTLRPRHLGHPITVLPHKASHSRWACVASNAASSDLNSIKAVFAPSFGFARPSSEPIQLHYTLIVSAVRD